VQSQITQQELLFTSSFQSSLEKQKISSMWKMDKKTLTQRGIKIPNENIYFFTPTKQSYFKQLQKMEMWEKKGEK